jgi:hypothetical protein
VQSGGNNLHRSVRNFNALYPNHEFSTEATIEAPANLDPPDTKTSQIMRSGQQAALGKDVIDLVDAQFC